MALNDHTLLHHDIVTDIIQICDLMKCAPHVEGAAKYIAATLAEATRSKAVRTDSSVAVRTDSSGKAPRSDVERLNGRHHMLLRTETRRIHHQRGLTGKRNTGRYATVAITAIFPSHRPPM